MGFGFFFRSRLSVGMLGVIVEVYFFWGRLVRGRFIWELYEVGWVREF